MANLYLDDKMEKLGNAGLDGTIIDMLINTGKTYKEIASDLNIDIATVEQVAKAYAEQKGYTEK